MNKSWVKEEIERKFLLRELPREISSGIDSGKFDFQKIEQGYIKSGARFRKSISKNGETEFSLIEKTEVPDTNGISRNEKIQIIDSSQFEKLLLEKVGEVLEKTRYIIPFESENLQLDVYGGRLEGNSLVEIEFDSLEKAKSFQKPDWFGQDMTQELSNYGLAMGEIFPQE